MKTFPVSSICLRRHADTGAVFVSISSPELVEPWAVVIEASGDNICHVVNLGYGPAPLLHRIGRAIRRLLRRG